MKTVSGITRVLPKVVSAAAWQRAREKLLVEEKKLTRAHDALAAKRRRMPMVRVAKDYTFEGPEGRRPFAELFAGRPQLVLYHFMFAPDVPGWPDAACPGCSLFVDNLGHPAHLNARDTTLVLVSRAPLANINRYKKRMGWKTPWYSSAGSAFNADFGLTTAEGETFGLSVFLKDGKDIYRTYLVNGRGAESFGPNWTFLDLTPFGRQERWEDSPKGWPQGEPYRWWRRHDEY